MSRSSLHRHGYLSDDLFLSSSDSKCFDLLMEVLVKTTSQLQECALSPHAWQIFGEKELKNRVYTSISS